ncbi:MAG TPA: HEAT repeat domain-containing protein [Thermoanaerobaculia bacterium]|nr:HEAT repeat domain-containing protein [Thermoanaerobaculia bacterium]
MEPFITFGLPLLAGGIYLLGILARHRQLLDQWQALAAKHELAVLETSSVAASRVSVAARAGVMEVRFEKIPKRGLWVHLTIPGLLATSGLRLRREPFVALGAREIETGDESFDQTFLVEGSAGLVMALLDSKARRLLLQINVEGELEIRGGVVSVRVTDTTLPQLLPLLLELGQRFTTGSDTVRRLAASAREDREAGVRLRSLLLLEREFPREQVTRDTLRAACSDPAPQIRLRAAIARGAEGRETLMALAEDPEVDDDWSAQAVSTLGRQLPHERTQEILRQSLRRRRLGTAHACLAALGQWRGAALDELVKVLEREPDALAAAAALALGESGEAAAEPPLLRALQHGSAEIRSAAATALGRVGTAAAVLPLKEAAEEDRELRRVARQSVAEIQSRIEGASPGQLSLAQSEAGQLSLATDPSGQLSLRSERPVA